MATLTLKNITKRFSGLSKNTIDNFSLTIADGEFIVFVGPSGCGKSTLLRMIAGLEDISSGALLFDGKELSGTHPARRNMAMVFQSYALYPHMTVRRNMAFALMLSKLAQTEITKRVNAAAELLELSPYLDTKPGQLSGGQRQRVAIGRAIVRDPKLFLFDEPLSNLDATLRVQTRLELSLLHKRLKTTMIYVTHDQIEAMTLADRIVVLSAGKLEQLGTPAAVYARPNNLFVAGFIGTPKMSLLRCTVQSLHPDNLKLKLANGDVFTLPLHKELMALPLPTRIPQGSALTLGLRPEAMHITDAKTNIPAMLKGTLEVSEDVGSDTFLHLRVGNETLTVRSTRTAAAALPAAKAASVALNVKIDPKQAHLFFTETGMNILTAAS